MVSSPMSLSSVEVTGKLLHWFICHETVMRINTLGSGLQIAARLKALGINVLIVERNQRIGDNWRNRYEYLSLHLRHWGRPFSVLSLPRTMADLHSGWEWVTGSSGMRRLSN